MHALVTGQAERFAIRPTSRVLQFASPGFDAATAETLVTLCSGATRVTSSADRLLPVPGKAGLSDLIERTATTHVTVPPSVLATLEQNHGEETGAALESVTTLVVAGEAAYVDVVRPWVRGGGR